MDKIISEVVIVFWAAQDYLCVPEGFVDGVDDFGLGVLIAAVDRRGGAAIVH